uniref:Uncharacterized protein n=1 Tax=Strombidinopsis acuminata TaxID=141414 RepID=A0A7S3U2B9_9SPIT|mmetsp:Transcript_87546/g.120635  ORF Transcript_87546/g.120635 Transcript_87546/m.120635 type:complete len:106 (+) Transcript_87546:8698-9015(+)
MKSEYDKQLYISKLDQTEVEFESDVVKILILKLLQLEKSLKEMGRIQKKRARKAAKLHHGGAHRQNSVSSRRSRSRKGSKFAKVMPENRAPTSTQLDFIEEGDEN